MSSSERESNLNNDVENWLADIGLSQYSQNFKNEGFDDLETIAWTFSNDTPEVKEILTKMGIKKIGHQQKILHKSRILKQSFDEKGNEFVFCKFQNEKHCLKNLKPLLVFHIQITILHCFESERNVSNFPLRKYFCFFFQFTIRLINEKRLFHQQRRGNS
jgi:hypothetical protein